MRKSRRKLASLSIVVTLPTLCSTSRVCKYNFDKLQPEHRGHFQPRRNRQVHRNRRSTALLMAVALGALSGARVASAQTLTTLVNFDVSNGSYPAASLLQGLDGNLYGTTEDGGSTDAHGTVFRVTPGGALTTLFSFCAPDGCKYTGDQPMAGLTQTANGILYGTAENSGPNRKGVVFTIASTGSETVLYNFCAQPNCADGAYPEGGLVQATSGDLYGTTSQGGTNALCPGFERCGTIFKITPAGALISLYSFCSQVNCADGERPVAGLVEGTDGNLYGTTSVGGTEYRGTIFRITPSGALTTLYTFCSQTHCADGAIPAAGLIQGTDGNFYGTTSEGGNISICLYGCGTIFRITPAGAFTTLYSFCSPLACPDGFDPEASLVQASDGNFYGTTAYGGNSAACLSGPCGTIFRITPAGVLTTLLSFNNTDGAYPQASLIQDTDGMLYGTSPVGGSSTACGPYFGCGTLFSLDVNLGPFVETLEPSGKVGATIHILGTALTGASSVTFNGTPATFKVISPSEIGTQVPSGATTGAVQVATPSRTLSSNVPFQILQ
jgi:uncharacterized repeat protein (TIGR03803 family)